MSTDDQHLENEKIPEDDEAQEELSLDQLSEAYALVLKGRRQESGDFDDGSDGSAAPNPELSENKEELAILDFAVAIKAKKKRKRMSLAEIDAEDNAPCPISPESILEAILFVGAPKGEKLTSRKIASVMRDVSPNEVKKMAGELNKRYEKENAAYRVEIAGGNYSLKLTEDLLHVQNNFFGRNRAARLSQGAVDILAIVAYNQPLAREQVERIRAKPSGAILSQLVRRELLQIEQTATKPGKNLYRTTDRFLNLFGLDTIEDLPQTSAVSDFEELAD